MSLTVLTKRELKRSVCVSVHLQYLWNPLMPPAPFPRGGRIFVVTSSAPPLPSTFFSVSLLAPVPTPEEGCDAIPLHRRRSWEHSWFTLAGCDGGEANETGNVAVWGVGTCFQMHLVMNRSFLGLVNSFVETFKKNELRLFNFCHLQDLPAFRHLNWPQILFLF